MLSNLDLLSASSVLAHQELGAIGIVELIHQHGVIAHALDHQEWNLRVLL